MTAHRFSNPLLPSRREPRPINEYDMVLAADDLQAVAKSMDAAQEAIFSATAGREPHECTFTDVSFHGCSKEFVEREAKLEAISRANMERRDQDAADYGEPETPHEFYAGRPGSQAETIVLDCLRKLRAIQEPDRLYVDELTDVISRGFLETSPDGKTEVRRAAALLRASRGEKA